MGTAMRLTGKATTIMARLSALKTCQTIKNQNIVQMSDLELTYFGLTGRHRQKDL